MFFSLTFLIKLANYRAHTALFPELSDIRRLLDLNCQQYSRDLEVARHHYAQESWETYLYSMFLLHFITLLTLNKIM